MPILVSNAPTVVWAVVLFLLAILSGYWFIAFYQKATRGSRDRFVPAFMLQYLSLTIFFLFLAVAIPLGAIYDEMAMMCGIVATVNVLLAFGLLHYEIWQERKR